MPWWGIALIALGGALVGGLIVYVVLLAYLARGFRRSF
jgi:hypothetical protein